MKIFKGGWHCTGYKYLGSENLKMQNYSTLNLILLQGFYPFVIIYITATKLKTQL